MLVPESCDATRARPVWVAKAGIIVLSAPGLSPRAVSGSMALPQPGSALMSVISETMLGV